MCGSRFESLSLLLFALTSCSSMEFRELGVVAHEYDETSKATHVTVAFEVWDKDLPVQDLDPADIQIFEDGVKATSESLASASPEIIRLPVTLLIDTSYSMYAADAVPAIKESAAKFVAALHEDGYVVHIMRFSSEAEVMESVDAIPDEMDPASGENRWTSLYRAIEIALEADPLSILVVFSDGADNYSQNRGIAGLLEVERMILEGNRQVHAIGFGDVRNEYDRMGVRGLTALRRLAVNGSFQFAEREDHFEEVFDFIARRMRSVYTLDYYSPNLSGNHVVVIQANAGRRSARSEPIMVSFGTKD